MVACFMKPTVPYISLFFFLLQIIATNAGGLKRKTAFPTAFGRLEKASCTQLSMPCGDWPMALRSPGVTLLLQFVKVPVRSGLQFVLHSPARGNEGDKKSTARANYHSLHSSTLAVDHGSQLIGAWTAGERERDCQSRFRRCSLIPYDSEMLERLLMRRKGQSMQAL